jgi:type VI secretion system secreted protein VgrG
MSVELSVEAEGASFASAEGPYAFHAFPFPPGHFRVHAVRGREALSKPYVFRVTVTTTALAGEDLERLALGHRAALIIRVGGAPRIVPGVIEAVRSEGLVHDGTMARYTFRLVPALALLRHQRGSRIFQDASVDRVVDQVLRNAGITARWDLTRHYPVRAYVTQYEESDLAFVQRLLAEAGIFYTFGSPLAGLEALAGTADAGLSAVSDAAALVAAAASLAPIPEEIVVFGDDASAYPPISVGGVVDAVAGAAAALGAPTHAAVGPARVGLVAPSLFHADARGLSDGSDRVAHFVATRRVRSDLAEYRDFDPARPHAPLVGRSARGAVDVTAGAAAATGAEIAFELDGGLSPSASWGKGALAEALLGLASRRRLETYEHHGVFLFPDWKDVSEMAQRIRRQTTRRRAVAEGESCCSALRPGHRFRLEDHPFGDHNREYAVVSVEHHGGAGQGKETYRNVFTCVPAEVTYAPPRPRRRTVQALLTATVVGPAGEEIHVDGSGRIKVAFHWDRRGLRDDAASCWIRAVQPWAGAGFGHQFFPRVGMEVAVTFEGGDTDKPVVIGSLYNGTHLPPFGLPANKTRSGIRTQTSPGGDGHNELAFEDAAGREAIIVHAQRDLDEVVRRNHTLAVRGDESIRVELDRRDAVGRNALYEVAGERRDVVHGDASIAHLGSRSDVVEKALDRRVGGARTTRIAGADDLEVRGAAEHRFGGDLTTRVIGNHTLVVGTHDAPRAMRLRVEGAAAISAEGGLELEAKGGLTLRCGKTSIRIGDDGIELQGPMVRIGGEKGALEAGSDGLKLSSEKVYAHLGTKLLVQSETASLAMGTEVKVDGARILLNSPEQATEEPPPEKNPPTEIMLTDTDGRPLGGQRFVVELEDGSRRTGVTAEDGSAALDLAQGGTIVFPDLPSADTA